MRPGLTLNFGLRYEPYSLFADTLDRNQTFDLAANRAGIRSKIYKDALPGLFYRGDAKPAGYGGGDTFFLRGNSNLSRNYRFVNSFVWDLPRLPNGTIADAVLGNWRLSGILTLQAGRPFGVGAANNSVAGAGSALADLVGVGYPVLDSDRSKGDRLKAYFDKARFANPAPNTYGTLGRNVLIGPGFANMDVSLAKGWRLPFFGEKGTFEYRFEAFNLWNATHMSLPITGLTNPNFGRITSTDGDPRILQLALKVGW